MLDVTSEIGHNAIAIGTHVYVLAGVLLLAGFILGFTNWALDVPRKFFQTKSRVQLLDNRVGNALGYAAIFFLVPLFVAGVYLILYFRVLPAHHLTKKRRHIVAPLGVLRKKHCYSAL